MPPLPGGVDPSTSSWPGEPHQRRGLSRPSTSCMRPPSQDVDARDKRGHDDGGYDFCFGTFLPFWRASDRPMAIACLRLLTFLPLRPLLSVPFLRLRIARSTSFEALFEYFRAMLSPPVAACRQQRRLG